MKNLENLLLVLLLSIGTLMGVSGTAHAAYSLIGGGEWSRGVTGAPGAGTVYSRYLHGTACHGATAVGTRTVRVDEHPGRWAHAVAPRANANNQTYWRNHC